MEQINYYSARDGETLANTTTDLEIVRRKKHEWRDSLGNLTAKKLAAQTDKINGSKFFKSWTLPALVDWIREIVDREGWVLQPGNPIPLRNCLKTKSVWWKENQLDELR